MNPPTQQERLEKALARYEAGVHERLRIREALLNAIPTDVEWINVIYVMADFLSWASGKLLVKRPK
jgi:hypothetical protein